MKGLKPMQPLRSQISQVIETKENFPSVYCVAELSRLDLSNQEMKVIFVYVERLADLYRLFKLNRNEVWRTMIADDDMLSMKIISTGNMNHCMMSADKHKNALGYVPICNQAAYRIFATTKLPIKCSNGKIYKSQSEAARAIGVAQSHISRCLSGKQKSVNGFTFAYVDADTGRYLPEANTHMPPEFGPPAVQPSQVAPQDWSQVQPAPLQYIPPVTPQEWSPPAPPGHTPPPYTGMQAPYTGIPAAPTPHIYPTTPSPYNQADIPIPAPTSERTTRGAPYRDNFTVEEELTWYRNNRT